MSGPLSKLRGKLKSSKGPIKLNLGCGTDYKQGWINIDNNSDDNIEKLDLNFDLRKPLPYKKNSVDFIFHEHLLEHLTVEEGQVFIKNCMKVLRKGGVMRIAMPDLEEAVALYLDPKWKNSSLIKDFGLDFVQTRAELLNMSFSWWGHKWVYDWEELKRRLKQAGFDKVTRCQNGKSKHKELKGLETRKQSTLVAEVTK